jgi:hypothetical protein
MRAFPFKDGRRRKGRGKGRGERSPFPDIFRAKRKGRERKGKRGFDFFPLQGNKKGVYMEGKGIFFFFFFFFFFVFFQNIF